MSMGVYIKDMEMPNNCGACPLRLAWCRERIYMVTRPERCPLVPVPPHGRLIDADALPWIEGRDEQDSPAYLLIKKCVDVLPTIIPADGKDTNVPTRKEGET